MSLLDIALLGLVSGIVLLALYFAFKHFFDEHL